MYSLFVFLAQAASSAKSGMFGRGYFESRCLCGVFCFYIGLDRQEVIMFGPSMGGFTCEIPGERMRHGEAEVRGGGVEDKN